MAYDHFNLTSTDKVIAPVATDDLSGVASRAAYIVFDAIAYVLLIFLCVQAALLRLENLVDLIHVLTVIFFSGIYIFASRAIYTKLFKAPLVFGLMLEYIAVFSFVAIPAFLVVRGPEVQNFCWLTLWWHQLPALLGMFLKLSPFVAVCLMIAFCVFTSQVVRKRPQIPMLAVSAIGVLLLLQYIVIMRHGFRFMEFVALPALMIVTLLSAFRGQPRLFAKSLLLFFIAVFASWHFLGLLPVNHERSFIESSDVDKVYPPADVTAPVPAALVKDIAFDPAGDMFYIAGGRSGYVLAIDTGSGVLHHILFKNADISRIAIDRWTHDMFALDRAGADVHQFAPGSLRAMTKHSVKTDWGFVPEKIIPFDNQFYVTYSEYPAIAEFSTAGFRQEGGISLRPAGMTTFRTGASDMVAVREAGALYAVAGAHGTKGESMIVRIDPARFVVNAQVIVPDYVRSLAVDRKKLRLYAAGYFKNNIYEIDLKTMTVARSLPAPPACSNVIFDAGRKLIYSTGYFNGELMIVDAQNGRMLDMRRTCNKIEAMNLDERRDRLYIACVNGVYSASLEKYISTPMQSN